MFGGFPNQASACKRSIIVALVVDPLAVVLGFHLPGWIDLAAIAASMQVFGGNGLVDCP